MLARLSLLALLLWPACAPRAAAREAAREASAAARPPTLAVLDLGAAEAGGRAAERLSKHLAAAGGETRVVVLDRGLARSAARGVGYAGSLNLTLREARDLGSAVGCDFFLTGDAQVVRRSSSERAVYFEAYATLFLVSARTGRLVNWARPAAEADAPARAEAALSALLDGPEPARLLSSIAEAWAAEASPAGGRGPGNAGGADEAGGDILDLTSGESFEGLREPAPYNRLRPAYTEAASRAEAEATVDVEADISADGRVGAVRVVRWAGFGLDEEVASTVRRMSFRPATLDGEPRPSRVLLRFNFRRPPPAAK